MDCNLAQQLIMKRADAKIDGKDALELHEHVSNCGDCRETYLVFDECMEALMAFENSEAEAIAPADFTRSVMAKVGGVTHSTEEIEKVKESGWVVLKLLWGFSAIILGVVLFLLFNPNVLETLINRYPVLENTLAGFEQAFTFLQGGISTFVQGIDMSSTGTMSVFALLFVTLMSILLFVLHSNEVGVKQ